MKKKVALILLSMLCLSGIASADWSPVRLCIYPEIAFPQGWSVYGLNIGLITGQMKQDQAISGVDISLGSVSSVDGLQVSLVTINTENGAGTSGLQVAGGNFGSDVEGAQVGFVNTAKDSSAVQIGLWNCFVRSEGVQIGIINLNDNGFLPIFPIINFSVK